MGRGNSSAENRLPPPTLSHGHTQWSATCGSGNSSTSSSMRHWAPLRQHNRHTWAKKPLRLRRAYSHLLTKSARSCCQVSHQPVAGSPPLPSPLRRSVSLGSGGQITWKTSTWVSVGTKIGVLFNLIHSQLIPKWQKSNDNASPVADTLQPVSLLLDWRIGDLSQESVT